MSRSCKLIGGHRVSSSQSVWTRYGNPLGSWTETALLSGIYYPTGAGDAQDLLLMFKNRVNAGLGTSWFDITRNNDTGELLFSNSNTDDIEIAFLDPAGGSGSNSLNVRKALNNGADTGSFLIGGSDTLDGDYPHAYGIYPQQIVFEDLDMYETRGAQAWSDGGNVTTTMVATRKKHALSIRLKSAYPRSTGNTYNEYHQMIQFFEYARTGLPFRFYPDKTNHNAWASPLASSPNTFGYETWVLAKESWGWKPAPAHGNWYAHFDAKLTLLEYISPS